MITRVLNEKNESLHDCAVSGCSVSWDGIALRDLEIEELFPNEKTRPVNAKRAAKGERVPNGQDPDAAVWTVTGKTAKLKANG